MLGSDCKVYYGAAGSQASTELLNVRDVTLGMEKGEADETTRSNAGWKSTAGGLKDPSLDIQILNRSSDAGYQALRDAYLNNTLIALLIRDAASGEGLDADFAILGFGRPEPLEDVVVVNITAKPNSTNRNPNWVNAA